MSIIITESPCLIVLHMNHYISRNERITSQNVLNWKLSLSTKIEISFSPQPSPALRIQDGGNTFLKKN